jgi:hypothetical protein
MNNPLSNRISSLCVVCLLAISLSACKKQIELTSRRCDQEIDFDGTDEQWGPATIYAEKQKISLTVLNDDEYIYMRLYTRDRNVQGPLLMSGFTVWFNSDGSKNKTTGIRFPMGMHGKGFPAIPGKRQDADAIEGMVEQMNEMEILGADEKPTYQMSLSEAKSLGINAEVSMDKGNLVYELKLPLVRQEEHPYAVGILAEDLTANKAIGVGFETQKIDRNETRGNMGGQGPPGGAPPQGGGMPPVGAPPEGGGMPPGSRERPAGGGERPPGSMPEQLSLWTKVTLASEP